MSALGEDFMEVSQDLLGVPSVSVVQSFFRAKVPKQVVNEKQFDQSRFN